MAGQKRRVHAWRFSDEQRCEIERRIGSGATQDEAALAAWL